MGLVSARAPLISNLTVWGNIALIRQYHENLSWHTAKSLAEGLLSRLGMAAIAQKRYSALTPEERFGAMLLRAAMVRNAVLVLDRPLSLVPHLRDGRYFIEVIGKLDDLIAEAHVFDYSWHKERYGVADDAEN